MADAKQLKNAESVYKTLCEMLDEHKWRYDRHDKDLCITFTATGEDIPRNFVVAIDPERDLVRLISPMPFRFSESKRIEGAIATCQVNYKLADGSFDYSFSEGRINFRMTSSYKDSLISKELFAYMIGCAGYTVDAYNDKFLMIDKGLIAIEDFVKSL